MNQDDRDTYRMMRDEKLLVIAREEGVTAEMGVVLAERLADSHSGYMYQGRERGTFQPRSIKA